MTTPSKEWKFTTLGDLETSGVIVCLNGYSSGEHNQDGDGIPHVRPFNVSPDGHTTVKQLKFIPEERHRETYSLKLRDVIFNNTNTEELVGKTASWRYKGLFGFSNHMTRLRVQKLEEMTPEFLAFYLHYHWQSGRSRQLCRRHVSQASIMGDRFYQIPVPKPSKIEQARIATVLTKIQEAIEVETDLIRVSRELKVAVMKKLFSEGLNGEPLKETEIGLVPASWEIKELREFVTIKSGGTPSREKPEYWNGGTIPWVKTGEVNYCVIEEAREYITKLGMENSAAKIFPKGTLLMAMYGQGVTRAKVAILGLDATTNQACAAIFPDATVSSVFLYHFLEYQYEQIREMGHGANQKNLNTDIIKAVKCPIPPPQEQAQIAKYLDVINSDLILREKKNDLLKDLFQSALANLMSGTIRVTDLDIDTTCLESQGVAA